MNILLYAVPAAAAVALLFAFIKARGIARHDEGEPGMAEIAHAISEGADAFLKSEYKLLLIFIAIVFAGIWLGLGSITTAGAFLVGALFSVLAGYFGMKVATRANVRTANAARTGGINEALRVAFSGGTAVHARDFLVYGRQYAVVLVIGLLVSTPLPEKLWRRIRTSPLGTVLLLVLFWVCVYCMAVATNDPFMYFSF